MFNKNYPFFTSSSKNMVLHFKNYFKWIKKNYGNNLKILSKLDLMMVRFLKNFKTKKNMILGIEPSKNVAKLANKRGVKTINKFFNSSTAKSLKNLKKNRYYLCGKCHMSHT